MGNQDRVYWYVDVEEVSEADYRIVRHVLEAPTREEAMSRARELGWIPPFTHWRVWRDGQSDDDTEWMFGEAQD